MRSRRHTKRVIFHDDDLYNEFLVSFGIQEKTAFQGVSNEIEYFSYMFS